MSEPEIIVAKTFFYSIASLPFIAVAMKQSGRNVPRWMMWLYLSGFLIPLGIVVHQVLTQ